MIQVFAGGAVQAEVIGAESPIWLLHAPMGVPAARFAVLPGLAHVPQRQDTGRLLAAIADAI